MPPFTVFGRERPMGVGDASGHGDAVRFRRWCAGWLLLPNLPYLPITLLGGPPRYPEIVLSAAIGLAVRRMPFTVQLTAFAAVTAFLLASFIAHMFNMRLTMLMSVAPLVAGINPAASMEYVAGAALLMVTFAGACRVLARSSAFESPRWLASAIAAMLLLAGGDYAISRHAMGSYARVAPAGAPFTSAVRESGLAALADGRTHVLLVMVEAMGEPRDASLRARLDRMWMRPEMAERWAFARGSTRFYGSTTGAEIRELCGRWGDYPELRAADPGCLPSQLGRRGYGTTSYHAFHADFFARDQWYPHVGLQRSVFGEDLLRDGASLCPNVFAGPCDRDIAPRIARQLAGSAAPQFVYWLTLNSHLPIVENRALRTQDCARLGGGMDADFPMVCRMFAVWEDTAEALVREMRRPDFPPTHVLIVGDHMPPLTHQRSRLLFDPERVPWILLRHRGARAAEGGG